MGKVLGEVLEALLRSLSNTFDFLEVAVVARVARAPLITNAVSFVEQNLTIVILLLGMLVAIICYLVVRKRKHIPEMQGSEETPEFEESEDTPEFEEFKKRRYQEWERMMEESSYPRYRAIGEGTCPICGQINVVFSIRQNLRKLREGESRLPDDCTDKFVHEPVVRCPTCGEFETF